MPLLLRTRQKIRRWWIWFYSKIQRDAGTPEYIARGWAIGMFYGCFIPFGLQLMMSIPSAFVLKGSKIGATLGTFVTNPFTIWFLYPLQCYAGAKILGLFTGTDYSYGKIRGLIAKVIQADGAYDAYKTLFGMGIELAAGFFIGGAILTAMTVPPTYYIVRNMVVRYRNRKALRRKTDAMR